MPHFFDEAQERENKLNKDVQEVIVQEDEIKNYNLNLFLPFHKILSGYIEKISALNPESRMPVVEIGFTHLENEFKFEYYASAYKMHSRKIFLFIKKEKLFIWWRRIVFTISEKTGMVKITVYEKGNSEFNYTDVVKKKMRICSKISELNEQTVLWILDYLGYKISSHELIKQTPHEERHH